MRKWISRQLAAEGTAPVVVIDHGSVATGAEIEAALGPVTICAVTDWFELRREWERRGRNRVVIATERDLSVPVESAPDPAWRPDPATR